MGLEESLKTYLLRGKQLSEDEASALRDFLYRKTLQELRALAKDMNVRLAGSSRKADIVDRMIGMVWIGAFAMNLWMKNLIFVE